jgi:predicted LPLAT superfamily acyltransferase
MTSTILIPTKTSREMNKLNPLMKIELFPESGVEMQKMVDLRSAIEQGNVTVKVSDVLKDCRFGVTIWIWK